MASRPLVTVQSVGEGKEKVHLTLPSVFLSPIRDDIVRFVHTNMAKNKRQAFAVSTLAGMQTAAESWGTGRAVARVPRVPGGGTHRAGQAAFGNMCRGGRMFSPTKVWRKWTRKTNKNQRRYAVCSALAATGIVPLVMARGHRVEQIPEIPLVVSQQSVDGIVKTKKAVELLKALHAYEDVQRVKDSKGIRRGKGKARNRRYVQRKGPLVVYLKEGSIVKSFRNIPGIELTSVTRLNLLQLAPGGHLGRFVIWTKDAFEKLDDIYGTRRRESKTKKGYKPPRSIVHNPDITRVINSDEVQSVLREKKIHKRPAMKRNPLKNLGALVKLNPFTLTHRRRTILQQRANAAKNKEAKAKHLPVKGKVTKKSAKTSKKQRSRFYKLTLLKEEQEDLHRRQEEAKKSKESKAQ